MQRSNSLEKTLMLEILKAGGEGATEGEMVGLHHQLNGHEIDQTLGNGEGQGSLAYYSPWDCKVSNMTVTEQQHQRLSAQTARDLYCRNFVMWLWYNRMDHSKFYRQPTNACVC